MAVASAAAQDELQDDLASALRATIASHAYLRDTTVVTYPGELPKAVQRHILREGVDPMRVRGVHANGRPYVVLSNIPDLATGVSVALHEAVGHLGLRAVLGADLERVMLQLYETFPRGHDAWQYTADLYGYLDTGSAAGKVAFGEELCAHLAERDELISEWEMVQAEIRQAIRADFPDLPMTELDVRALVQRSRESLILRHGAPEEVTEVRERQQRRQRAAGVVRDYRAREGKGGPDALALALYRDGSRVVDGDGIPCRLYHGAGGEVDPVRRGFWGVVDPGLANNYAEMRADQGAPATVIPFYANIQRPFDGDALKDIRADWDTPDGLTVPVFVEEVIRQAGLQERTAEDLRQLGLNIARRGRQEESGPTYDPQNFWYTPHWMFGREGAELLEEVFERAGFDGVRFTEQGSLTYGAFSAAQVHFLDQGASPRGWQPDRHHGEGPVTERQPFREWFAESQVVDEKGQPRMMYHGTDGDIVAFEPRKIRRLDIDAECNGYWFSSSTGTSPAMRAATNVMPVYLSIQNPAPYPLVDRVSRQVRRDKKLRYAARSTHDEVRYRLQDMGYDGFFFNEPMRLTDAQRETYARTGQVALTDARGFEVVLRRGEHAIQDWQDVHYQADGMAYQNKHGGRVTHDLSRLTSMELLKDLCIEGVFSVSDADKMFEALDKIDAFLADKEATLALGEVRLEHIQIDMTYEDLLPTGEVREVVDLYDEQVGHVTSYADLDDFEAMHKEVIAVAFRPEQIKSAIGNRGTFLRNHPDIRFSMAMAADPYAAPIASAVEEIKALGPRVAAAFEAGDHDTAERLDYRLEALYQRVEDGHHQAEEEGLAVDGEPLGKSTASRAGDEVDEEASFELDLGNRYAALFHGWEAGWHTHEEKVAQLRGVIEDYAFLHGGMREGVTDDDILAAAEDAYRLVEERYQRGRAQAREEPQTASEAFQRWFGQSVAVDDEGNPLVVYRGEHGRLSPQLEARFGPSFQSRLASLSFSTAEVASGYALAPNDRTQNSRALQARVTPVYLSIQKPVMNRPEDPFLEMEEVIPALGTRLATRMAEEMAERIEETGNWIENFSDDYEGVTDLLQRDPERLRELYLQAYPVFDSPRYVAWFRAAGFDGAVHGGSGESAGEGEYKVFAPEQVKSVCNRGTYNPREPDIRLSVAPGGGVPLWENSAFREWFGQSRVVDRSGMPRVVYKGMHPYDWRTESADNPRGEEITSIDRPTPLPAFFEDDPGVNIAGFFGDRDTANHFGTVSTRSGALYPVYLAIESPYEVDAAGALAGELQFGATGQAFREAMRSEKYDGAILHNTGDEGTVYIAKRADQIKSVFNTGAYDPADPDIRFSFAGKVARNADRIQLHHAQACLAAGMDEDLVRQETGWFRGVDGGWRFEIDDSDAVLYPALRSLQHGARTAKHIESFDHRKHDNGTYTVTLRPNDATTTTDFIEFEQVSPDVLRSVLPPRALHAVMTGEGTDEWGGLMPEAGLTVREPFEFYGFATLPLSHVLDHPALFESYPSLKNIPVTVDPGKGQNASLVTLENGRHYIELGRGNQLSALMHEVQHVVQRMEWFAQGGNIERMHDHAEAEAVASLEAIETEYARVGRSVPEVLASHAALDATRQSLMIEEGLNPRSRADQAELRLRLSPEQQERLARRTEAYWSAVEEAGGFGDERISEFVGLAMDREDARFATSIPEQEALDRYRRLAGEVEARNVQARASLTAEQRRESDPVETEDIHRGQQLILDASGTVTPVLAPGSLPSLSVADGQAGEVTNRTQAGEALQAAAADMIDVLSAAGHNVGWMDGGCRILADALEGWSGGVIRLAVTGQDPAPASHVVGALPVTNTPGAMAVLLDADGVSSPGDMLKKLEEVENSPGERVLAVGVKADHLSEELLSDTALSGRVSRLLRMRLGSFDSWRDQLHEELVELGYPLQLEEVSPGLGRAKPLPRSPRGVPQV